MTKQAAQDLFPAMHCRRENQSLAIHRRIAVLILREPDVVIGKAVQNLTAWLNRRGSSSGTAVYQEWLEFLERHTPEEIAHFIVSESETADRMRQSSPFAGVLPPREVWAIKRANEAA